MGKQRTRIVAGLLGLIILLSALQPAEKVKAGEPFSLDKTKLTLYVGNTWQLHTTGGEELAADDYWWWGYSTDYRSSNPEVAVVDYQGLVRATGVGTATITATCGNETATCKVKVKENSCVLDRKKITVYQEQTVSVKLSSNKRAKSYSTYVCEKEGYGTADYALQVDSKGKGVFEIAGGSSAGSYYVDFAINATDGKSYSARCEVEVLPCGLEKSALSVVLGETISVPLVNAELLSVEIDTDDDEWYGSDAGEQSLENPWDFNYVRGDAAYRDGSITGTKGGKAEALVRYLTAYGEEKEQYLDIYITNPQYIPFEGYMRVGQYYYPQFTGISYYSTIGITSSEPGIARVDGWNGNYIQPLAEGTVTLVLEVDGVKFTQKVQVIDPKLPEENIVLTVGKTRNLTVSGLPKGSKITWKSSDKSVVKVSTAGKLVAKGQGYAMITAAIDDFELCCTVNVGTGKGVEAVQKGYGVLGAAYSQEKRMQTGYYDCSSFVWRSYNAAGVRLAGTTYAPTAAELAKKLEAEGKAIAYEYVDPDELLPGDIIFYSGGNNGRYKNIDHVAMYYGAYCDPYGWYGEENIGMVIHASGNVHMKPYYGYRNWSIVMIARPIQ